MNAPKGKEVWSQLAECLREAAVLVENASQEEKKLMIETLEANPDVMEIIKRHEENKSATIMAADSNVK